MSKTSSTSSVTRAVPAESRPHQRSDRDSSLRRRRANETTSRRAKPKDEAPRGTKSETTRSSKESAPLSPDEGTAHPLSGAPSAKTASPKEAGSARCDRRDGARGDEAAGTLSESDGAGAADSESGLRDGALSESALRTPQGDTRDVGHDLSKLGSSSMGGRTSMERAEVARAAMVSDTRGRFDLQEMRSVRVQLEHGVTMQFSQNGQGASARLQSPHALGAEQREELRSAVGQHGYALDEDADRRREGGADD